MLARLTTFILALVASVTAATAQPLADRIPDDAMVYVGWQGTARMGAAYEQSHLKPIVDATDWRQMFEEFLPAVMAKVGDEDADAAEVLRVASSVGRALWQYETAIYFGGLIAGQREGPPSPKLAVLVRAGKDAAVLAAELNDAIHKGEGEIPFQVKAAAYGDLVAVTTGAWPGFEALLGNPAAGAQAAPALKSNGKFVAAMQQAQPDPAVAVYVDVEAIVKMVDGFVALGAKPEQQHVWRKARKISGIGGVRQLAMTGAFDGKDFVSHGFLGAPAPRQGLVSLLDGEPMSEEILNLVPQDVLVLTAGRFDLAKLVSTSRASTAAADPEWGRTVDRFIAQGSQWAGMDLEKDVLASLGPDFAAYTSPAVGGTGLLGLCLVNRPRDVQKLDASLAMLATRATESIQRQADGDVTIAFKSKQVNGVTLHYLAVPFVTPTWAVVDGNLYAGLYPQVVLSAAAYAKREGPSVLKNEKFAAVRQRLGQQKTGTSVSFADLPRTAPNAYGSWLAITRYAGIADLFGIDSPLMLVPPIDQLMPHLAPAGQSSWVDDDGWHMSAVTPFPGADLLAQDPLSTMMTAQPAIMASILVPSLNRARTTANRVKSASNLKQIGNGLFLYANDHKGKFPDTLGELAAATDDLPPSVFVNPNGNTEAPNAAPDKATLSAWVNDSSDYVYLGAGKTNAESPETIIAYEKPETNDNQGMNVLFGDGHVEWLDYHSGMERIDAQLAKEKNPADKL